MGGLAVYLLALFIPLMDVDAAQYASISAEMARTNSFLEVFNRQEAYLDKPPLLFWISAISLKVFPNNADWAYRIPTLLAILLGSISVNKLTKMFYGPVAAGYATLTLLLSQAIFLTVHDCRTDTLLMSMVTTATYFLLKFERNQQRADLYFGFAFIAFAMMAKGPIGLMVPAWAIGSHFILFRKWKSIFNILWLEGLAFAFLLLLPMVYGLYTQFGWEGPKFFFWTQSFGRITGENVWENDVEPLFLINNFLWSILPFTIPFLAALVMILVQFIKSGFYWNKLYFFQEGFAPMGFLLSLIALSQSHYQLPHYIYVALGYAAIITGVTIERAFHGNLPILKKVLNLQWLLVLAMPVLAYLLVFVCFPNTISSPWLWVWGLLFSSGLLLLFLQINFQEKVFRVSLLLYVLLNGFLAYFIYPEILKYQAPTALASYLKEKELSKYPLATFEFESHALDFYSGRTVPTLHKVEDINRFFQEDNGLLFLRLSDLEKVNSSGLEYEVVKEFGHFHVTKLTPIFLKQDTRAETLEKCILIRIIRLGIA